MARSIISVLRYFLTSLKIWRRDHVSSEGWEIKISSMIK